MALDPVHHADYSAALAVRELMLLEDHARRQRMRCKTCVRKHYARALAYAQEATALDGATADHEWLADSVLALRGHVSEWRWDDVAVAVRALRHEVDRSAPRWLV